MAFSFYGDEIHIKLTILTHTTQWNLARSPCCTTTTLSNSKKFSPLQKKNFIPFKQAFPLFPTPRPWQPPVCFLSLWIHQFWIFYISGITDYVALGVQLLSLNVFEFNHVLARITMLFLFTLSNIPLHGHTTFVYSLISWWTFGLVPAFGYCESCFYEYLCTSTCLRRMAFLKVI